MNNEQCENCIGRVVWAGIGVNLVLVTLKLLVGITSGSKACIADALHSASNIITAFAIMVSQRIGKKVGTREFPYGYGKVEFIAAGFISILIIAGAIILVAVSIEHLVKESSAPPHLYVLLMGVISIGANEMLFRYMRCVGNRFKSQTILANAWANRADSFSSFAVIIGVVGGKLGLHHLDPIAAIFVVAVIIKVSIKILVDSVKALMESSVNDVYGERIETIVEAIEDVRGISGLKTRHIGQKIWVELDILVDQKCSVWDSDMIADRVKKALLEKIGDLEKVFVHLEPVEMEGC